MTAPAKLDVEDVRAELRIEDVINRYGLKVRKHGRTLRAKECPRCKLSSSSEAIVFNPRKNTWGHFGCGKTEGGECFGSAIDLVAVCEGLDTKRDFAKVLEIAAKIAGVEARPLTDEERAARRAYREQQASERQRQADAEEASMLREAGLKASSVWQRLLRNREQRTLLAYLRHRGLNGRRLADEDYVRCDLLGNPHIPLWSLDDSELINVVHRVITPADGTPKVLGLPGCPTAGTLCGRIKDIGIGSTVVIAEGVIDTLTAIDVWPKHVVLGAHGAGRMARIVETVAPLVFAKGGKVVLVPDGDDVGQRCAIKAGEAAMAAGLEMDKTLLVVELGNAKDLNEAHCAGWKP